MKTQHVNGIDLEYVDLGTGTAIVLVHGFPLDHTMWNAQIEGLSAAYRVIAPDLRGFGRSGVTDGVVTMEQFADDVAALLDALRVEEPIVLCGLSMGGYVAFQFWRRYAERLRGLILCDTRAANDTPEVAAGRLEMAQRVLREGPTPLTGAMMPKLFAEKTVHENPAVVRSLRDVMMGTDRRGIAAAARGMAERPSVVAVLSEIACPTLVVVGRLDAISTAEEMREIARAIPGAGFVEIAGSGHMSPMEKPTEVNAAILEFVGGLAPPSTLPETQGS